MTIYILTGVSGSGKTTLADKLVSSGNFLKPLNFTTRQPRNDAEFDDYVFLTENQFKRKLANGDFAETTYYDGNYYGISRFLSQLRDYVVVLEPNGRQELNAYCERMDYDYVNVFIESSREVVINRMRRRGDSERGIKSRLQDFLTFFPNKGDLIINGDGSAEETYNEFIAIIQGNHPEDDGGKFTMNT